VLKNLMFILRYNNRMVRINFRRMKLLKLFYRLIGYSGRKMPGEMHENSR
jgi:hypothetical protein